MEKFIYSIKEIEDKAKITFSERQLKKDWLGKHIELISSKTVLQDLKLGEESYLEAESLDDVYEKFRLYQQSLVHYFLAYFRSHGKDRKTETELINAKEEYHSHLFNYFLNISDDFNYFKKDFNFILNLESVLKEGEELKSVKDALEQFEYNKQAYELYKNIIDVKEERIDFVRTMLIEYKNKKTKVADEISRELQVLFIKKIKELEQISNNHTVLVKVNRTRLLNLLKFVRYFNTKSYSHYKNIISKFYSYRSISYYIENEFSFEDYEGLEKNYDLYIKNTKVEGNNTVLNDAQSYLISILKEYNKNYFKHNLQKFLFDNEIQEFDINRLFFVEKFYKVIDTLDFDILKELNHLKSLERALDKNVKIEELLNLLDRSYLSICDILSESLVNIYENNFAKIEEIRNFKLLIVDKMKKQEFLIIFKDIVNIGRSLSNDIVISSLHVSNEHLSFDLTKDTIINKRKEQKLNISFYNNKKESFDTLDIYHDKVKEINIANLFTYFLEETYDKLILLNPIEEKTNIKYLNKDELIEFNKRKYLLLREKSNIIIDMNEGLIVKEENTNTINLEFNKMIQINKFNKRARTLKFGMNYFDSRYEYILERIDIE